MGLWPGDDHFGKRYDYSTEYVRVMQELWSDGHSDFKGEYFQMDACKLSPRPATADQTRCRRPERSRHGVRGAVLRL